MAHPARLLHLVTRPIVVAKLWPTCAAAHNIDDDYAVDRMTLALKGSLHEELVTAMWSQLTAAPGRPSDEALLDDMAAVLKKRGERPGKVAKLTPAWNAFLVLVDVRAGSAEPATQALVESERGKALAAAGLIEAAKHLASEVTSPKK